MSAPISNDPNDLPIDMPPGSDIPISSAELGQLVFSTGGIDNYLSKDVGESAAACLQEVTEYLNANASSLEDTLNNLPDSTDPELAELLQEFAPLIGSTSDKSPSSVIDFIKKNASRFASQLQNLKKVDPEFANIVSTVLVESSIYQFSLDSASLLDILNTMPAPKVTVTPGEPVINTWFKGSMVTALFKNNQILLQSLSQLKQIELTIEIASMQKALNLAKDCASLILKSADKDAWQHYTAAIGAAISAVVSAVSVGYMFKAASTISKDMDRQKQNFTNETSKAKLEYERNLTRFAENNPKFKFQSPTGAGELTSTTNLRVLRENPHLAKTITPAEGMAGSTQLKNQMSTSGLNKSASNYERAKQNETKFDLERNATKAQQISTATLTSQAVATGVNSLVTSVTEGVKGTLTLEKGNIDALLEMLRALKDMYLKQQDSASNEFRSGGDLVSKILQDMNKAVDSLIQAFSSLRG